MWKYLEPYFTFSKGERRAVLAIVVVTLLSISGIYVYNNFFTASQSAHPEYEAEMQAFIKSYNAANAAKETIITSSPHANNNWAIDINTADSALWEKQYGIGPVLARRIVNFRNALGGFVAVEQISEVYGLPDSTYRALLPHLKIKNISPAKINLNEARLAKHPYIKKPLAQAIVQYRKQHGNFNSVNELKNIPAVTDSVFKKIEPYVGINAAK